MKNTPRAIYLFPFTELHVYILHVTSVTIMEITRNERRIVDRESYKRCSNKGFYLISG